MKPETIKKISPLDFDSLSTDEMGALIDALTELHKERVNHEKRLRKAEEYETRIYDLISEAQSDGFYVVIDNKYLVPDCTVEVHD